MATWTNISANTADWSVTADAGVIESGEPIGLLLCLTYAVPSSGTTWANVSANSTSWSNVSVN